MKIAVLGTRGFPNVPGGIEAHCANLYPCLVEKGCDVTVFTRKGYVDANLNSYKGVKLVALDCMKNKFLEAFLHTFFGVFAANKISPDILHIHGIGPSLIVPLARILGLKVVMTNHGPDYKRKKWGTFAKLILAFGEYLGSRYTDGVISISEDIAARVRKKCKREPFVIPNGVTTRQPLQDEDLLAKYGLTKGRYILSVGRFVPEKGFHDLIEAFNNIKAWRLVIAGDSNHPDRYSLDLKKKAAGNKDIVLTGFLNGRALQELYSHAGLFVLPSYYEGMPIVLLEAMSYGVSCIATKISANRGLGLDESRFFRPGDIQALANKIRVFMARPLTEEEKNSQIDNVAENYNWGHIADRTLKVYRQVEKG